MCVKDKIKNFNYYELFLMEIRLKIEWLREKLRSPSTIT